MKRYTTTGFSKSTNEYAVDNINRNLTKRNTFSSHQGFLFDNELNLNQQNYDANKNIYSLQRFLKL